MLKATVTVLALLLSTCEGTSEAQSTTQQSVNITIEGCAYLAPVETVEDCEAWDKVYTCLGATETERSALRWIGQRESDCGRDMINRKTSDIGECQLNGVHGKKATDVAVARFGLTRYSSLREWRSNVSSQLGNTRILAACLHLLRSSDDGRLGEPDAFKGCSNWKVHRGIKRGFGCGVA